MRNAYFTVLLGLIFIYSCGNGNKNSNQQEKKNYYLEGYVKDTKGEPIAGLTIWIPIVEHNYRQGISDQNGYYQIQLPHQVERVQLQVLGPRREWINLLKDTVISKKDIEKHEKIILPDIRPQWEGFVEVRGKVENAQTGEPMRGIGVWKELHGFKIHTNYMGNYVFWIKDSIGKDITLHFTSLDQSWTYDTTFSAKQGDVVTLPTLKMTKEQTLPKVSDNLFALQGKVVNANGEPLENISVIFQSRGGARTREDGTFSIIKFKTRPNESLDTISFQKDGVNIRHLTVELKWGKTVDLDTIILKEEKK